MLDGIGALTGAPFHVWTTVSDSEFRPSISHERTPLASAGMMLSAPYADDFSCSDAPRHALNGAFILDLLRDRPWHDPAGWAISHYIKYPALTRLFDPPFFYLLEFGFYALFGVTNAAAQRAETLFIFLLGYAAFAFARQFVPWVGALGVSLMTIGTPEIAYWDRQVMLDIPAFALGLISAIWCVPTSVQKRSSLSGFVPRFWSPRSTPNLTLPFC